MTKTIFLAGAAGAIGRPLSSLLVAAGYRVVGTTRSDERARWLGSIGAEACVLDVFDAEAVRKAVIAARPDVVIHQLTDLPRTSDPAAIDVARQKNARIRIEGTKNLVDAARAAGVTRMVAQSIAFVYAPGPTPHAEDAALMSAPEGNQGATLRGVRALEAAVLGTPGLDGIVLRYGRLYGPGTGVEGKPAGGPVHVDAAAQAALLAVERGAPGIYNVAEDDGTFAIDKARAAFGWDPAFRLSLAR